MAPMQRSLLGQWFRSSGASPVTSFRFLQGAIKQVLTDARRFGT